MQQGVPIQLKSDKDQIIAFAQGPAGEVLFISAFPGAEAEPDPGAIKKLRDAILNDDHHIKQPNEYITIKEINSNQGVFEIGLPPLTGLDLIKYDLRQGIRQVSEQSLKDIKG